jgi:hypothetical protein
MYSNHSAPYQPNEYINFNFLLSVLRGRSLGRSTCPLCSPWRKPQNKRKTCLTVWGDMLPLGLSFICNNCGEKGWVADGDEIRKHSPVQLAQMEADRQVKTKLYEAQQISRARKIWDRARKLNDTTEPIARAYFEGRGLNFIDVVRRQVRYLPDYKFWEEEEEYVKQAIVLPIRAFDDVTEIIGVQVTVLDIGPSLEVKNFKINGKSAKRTHGSFHAKGAIMLGRLSTTLAVTEGLETAMGVMKLGKWSGPLWAMLGTANMASMPLFDDLQQLGIFADSDDLDKDDTRPGSVAALRLRETYRKAGRAVQARRPKDIGDYADMAQGKCSWTEVEILPEDEDDE